MFKLKLKPKPISKAEKLATTERYLAARRKVARQEMPLSFRPRTSASYYSLYSHKF